MLRYYPRVQRPHPLHDMYSTSKPSSLSPLPPHPTLRLSPTAEAAPLIERLGLVEDPDRFSAAAPSKCFSGSYKGAAINVVTNGKCARFGVDQIGTVAAGLSTWLSVEVRGARRHARITAPCVCVPRSIPEQDKKRATF